MEGPWPFSAPLSIIPDEKGSPETVIDLHRNSPRWNRFAIAKPIQATSVTLEWRPSHPDAMLREIELWGTVAGSNDLTREIPRLPADLFHGLPAGAYELKGTGSALPVSVASVFGGGEGGRFTVKLDQEPSSYVPNRLVAKASSRSPRLCLVNYNQRAADHGTPLCDLRLRRHHRRFLRGIGAFL
jgi:hypothetical protein